MNRKGYALIIGLATIALAIVLGVARGGKTAAANTAAAVTSPTQPSAPAQPQVRSGGKLDASELSQLKAIQDDAAERAEAMEANMRRWTRKSPMDRDIAEALEDDAAASRIANVRFTLWLRRVADRHGLDATCFAGGGGVEMRERCGAKLWGFDGKTGEIALAPAPAPAAPPQGPPK